VAGGGYWAFRQYAPSSHPAPILETVPAPVAASSAAVAIPATAPAAPLVVAPAPVTASPEPPKAPVFLQVQQEWKGSDSGIKEARLVVVRSKEKWDKLWAEMQQPEPGPPIDFSQHVAIGVFGGEQPSGSSIAFEKIREMDNEVSAPYRFVTSETRASTVAVSASFPAHPYLLSLLARVDKKIRLTQKEASQ